MFSNTARDASISPFSVDLNDIRRVVLIALVSSVFGLLYSVIMVEGLRLGLLNGVLNGLMIGVLDTLWIRKRRGRWLRQLPILFYITLLTLLWVMIITINMVLTRIGLGLSTVSTCSGPAATALSVISCSACLWPLPSILFFELSLFWGLLHW